MSYRLDPRREGDGFYIDTRKAGANLGARKLVYLNSSGRWNLADEDNLAKLPVLGLTQHAITAGSKGQVLVWGIIGDSDWSWTLGDPIYASAVAGELTQTKPSTGEYPHIQSIALPIESTLIMFNPAFKSDLLNDVVMMNDNNWDDLRFPASAIRLGGDAPATAQAYKDSLVLAFASNPNQFIYVIAQLPHAWEEGTSLVPHIHWTIPVSGAGGGAENVKWDLTYSWANIAGSFPASTPLTVTRDVQDDTLDDHLYTTIGIIDGVGKTFSSCLIISLKRDTGVASDYANAVYLVEFDIHYKQNRLGTYDENPP